MKKIGIYSGGVVLLSLMFCVCYYFSYENALKDFNQKARQQEKGLYTELLRVSEENQELLGRLALKEEQLLQQDEENNEVLEAGRLPQNTVLPTVHYVEETYDLATKQMYSMAKTAPGFLIGTTKEELSAYLAEYMEDLSLAEYEAGLISYDIISFSEDNVILRKTYDVNKVPYKYYVNISDGMITVYYSDLKSVYEYTHIPAVDLSEEDRLALIEGIYVKDREELYSILEGFSS